MNKLFFTIIVSLYAFSAQAGEPSCYRSVLQLHTEPAEMSVSLVIDGDVETFPMSAERVLGQGDDVHYTVIERIRTRDDLKKEFCKGALEDYPVIFPPTYMTGVSYWYLFDEPKEFGRINKLILFEGEATASGYCKEILEGYEKYEVDCNT